MLSRTYKNLDEIDINKWVHLLQNTSLSNIFQSPEYFAFLKLQPQFSPFVTIVEDNDEYQIVILGFIQIHSRFLKKFTSRAIIEGGILINEDSYKNEYLNNAILSLENYLSKKVIFSEIRNYNSYDLYIEHFKTIGWKYLEHYNIYIDCTDLNSFRKKLSNSKLRQINKSQKNGAKIILNPTIEQVQEFYLILKELYNQKVKKPIPNLEFFKTFYLSGLGKYLLISYNQKIIGGIMCPIFKDKVIYEWYIAGLDIEYKELYPSVLATYAPILYAFNNNISRFDFMGAGKPEENYGVRNFKMKFGGELVNHGRFLKIYKKLIYSLASLYFKYRQ
jgi:serine/alanine adding enzyme